ncbi:ubiquinone biosynthesis protein coq9 mitochondrial [Phtheirospermum japonicum]|uniref:Ubiquinone biosynthesis protein n=1 Tax=Phtheirospermum japonicum TaxID=374723 RepID=A0A830BNL1_9LAMI|nr:ubiquinone biosynthesis protein coq9 mitochondrial [Phtheirospermum japonicum]
MLLNRIADLQSTSWVRGRTNRSTNPIAIQLKEPMYRSAARLLLPALYRRTCHFRGQASPLRFSAPMTHPAAAFSAAAASGNAQHNNHNNLELPNSSSSSSNEGAKPKVTDRPKAHWQEEQARVLQSSLRHVNTLGWSDAAMIAGAREVGVSPSIVGSFPRKEAALVEFFMDDCLQKLINIIDSKDDLKTTIASNRVAKLVGNRLEMQAPYISKWPQALSIQAQPSNIATSFKQRAMLVDEIWHATGDEATDIDWYVKRTVLGGIYSTTELYMLTDNSPDFQDTWTFLDERVKEAFDFKKSVQEAKYLFEAVGAGMGGSMQGFVTNFLKG